MAFSSSTLIQWSANQLPVLLDKEISSSNWLANRLALPKPVKRKIKHQTQQYRWAEADSGLIKAPCATIPPQQSHRLIASMRCCTDEVHCAKGAPPPPPSVECRNEYSLLFRRSTFCIPKSFYLSLVLCYILIFWYTKIFQWICVMSVEYMNVSIFE